MCGTFLLIGWYRRSIEKEDCAKYYNGDRKFGFSVERGYIYIYETRCKPFFSVQKNIKNFFSLRFQRWRLFFVVGMNSLFKVIQGLYTSLAFYLFFHFTFYYPF